MCSINKREKHKRRNMVSRKGELQYGRKLIELLKHNSRERDSNPREKCNYTSWLRCKYLCSYNKVRTYYIRKTISYSL
jgi:hypothetical protein